MTARTRQILGCVTGLVVTACCWQARAAAAVPGGATPAGREPVAPLALEGALELALASNPGLTLAFHDVRASEAREVQAGKMPNPELDLRLYRLQEQDGQEDVERRRVIVSQDLELGGKRGRRVDLAQAEREIAGWDQAARRSEVATAVAVEFAAVLGAQRRVEIHRRSVDFFEGIRAKVLAAVQGSSLRGVEVHNVTRQLGLARIELQRAEAELAGARHRLAATWGSDHPRFTEAIGDLERPVTVPSSLAAVMELARQGPAAARMQAEVERGQAALALARAARVPDLKFGAGVRWTETRNEPDYLADFEISIPIFDRKQGDIREARHDLARAQAQQQVAEVANNERIAELYFALAAADARRTTLAGEVLPAARATFEAYRTGFEASTQDLGGLFGARRDVARAEADHVDALVDYHQAVAALEALVGRPLAQAE